MLSSFYRSFLLNYLSCLFNSFSREIKNYSVASYDNQPYSYGMLRPLHLLTRYETYDLIIKLSSFFTEDDLYL